MFQFIFSHHSQTGERPDFHGWLGAEDRLAGSDLVSRLVRCSSLMYLQVAKGEATSACVWGAFPVEPHRQQKPTWEERDNRDRQWDSGTCPCRAAEALRKGWQ